MLGGPDRTWRGLGAVAPAARGSRREGRYMDGGRPLTLAHMVSMVEKPGGPGRLGCPVP